MGTWYVKEITIDSHERIRGVNAYNYYTKKYNVSVEALQYGDYIFITHDDKKVVFEFKTCEDFIKSMEDKSLFHEVSNQSISYDYSYLIICGDFEKTFDDLYWKVPHYRYKYKTLSSLKGRLRKQINGALNRIYAMYIPIIFVNSEEEAFEEMLKISHKVADAKRYGGLVRPVPNRYLKENYPAFCLSGLKGIGKKKSVRITDTLGIECIDDLCKQSPDDFLSVKKVSVNNVKEIWEKVHNDEPIFKDKENGYI